MAVRATTTNTGISARKVKPVLDLLRGMNVEDALETLQFMPSAVAAQVAKVVKSATANAENELERAQDYLAEVLAASSVTVSN